MQKNPMLSVAREGDGYEVTFDALQREASLYASATPYDAEPAFLRRVSGPRCWVASPLPGERVYFALDAGARALVWAADRAVEVDGVENFRDLGGYAAADGRAVRWGRFFRSGAVCRLSDQGRRALAGLRLAQVIDLRAAHEATALPDELPDGVAYHLAPAIDVDHVANGLLDMDMLTRLRGVHSDADAERYDAMFTALYATLPFGNAAYRRMFDALDAPDALPMLLHCSAGKDRTGVGCALLLLALGASRQTVIDDYMLSNRFRADSNQAFLAALAREGISRIALQFVERMISTSTDLLQGTLSAIDARYPTFAAFLQAEYAVDAPRLARWRAAHTV